MKHFSICHMQRIETNRSQEAAHIKLRDDYLDYGPYIQYGVYSI